MTTALLIIDIQQALCSGKYAAFEVDRVIDRINFVSRKARIVGAHIVVIQHETQGGLLDHGTQGWQIAKGLGVQASDIRIRKTATDSFHNTQLASVLQTNHVSKLLICGLQSEFCVDTTTRRALALGYPVTLISDGHSTMNNSALTAAQVSAHHNETLANITSFGPRVTATPAAQVIIESKAKAVGSMNLSKDSSLSKQ
jgi:nicotinamidase-related amidase